MLRQGAKVHKDEPTDRHSNRHTDRRAVVRLDTMVRIDTNWQEFRTLSNNG